MIAVVSRVLRARVRVGADVVGELDGPGLLVLLGVHDGDDDAQVVTMVRKVAELRLLRGDQSVTDTLATDAPARVLVVSQFTLCADTTRGRRPSFTAAARPGVAEPLFDQVVAGLRARGVPVGTGCFGAEMAVSSDNDGPFTVLVRS